MKEKAKSEEEELWSPEEKLMLKSFIEKSKRDEEKSRKIDIPGTIISTKTRINNLELSEESELSSGASIRNVFINARLATFFLKICFLAINKCCKRNTCGFFTSITVTMTLIFWFSSQYIRYLTT
jgi:hypothetical protein